MGSQINRSVALSSLLEDRRPSASAARADRRCAAGKYTADCGRARLQHDDRSLDRSVNNNVDRTTRRRAYFDHRVCTAAAAPATRADIRILRKACTTMTTSPVAPDSLADTWATQAREYFAAADQWNFDVFGQYLSPDVRFRFGNTAPLRGLDTMLGFAREHQKQIKSVQHSFDRCTYDIERRRMAIELTVKYVRHDDIAKTYPAAVLLDFDIESMISGYRVFVDLSDLLS
jgi:hypothetical protein